MTRKKKAGIEIFSAAVDIEMSLPFAEGGVKAGFPSPAQDYLDNSIDLNKELIKHPASTFFGRVSGDSMKDAGLEDGDILVIDRSLEAHSGDAVVCFIDGEFVLKYIEIDKDVVWLNPANPDYKPIRVTEDNMLIIWGVVTYSIKNFYSRKK